MLIQGEEAKPTSSSTTRAVVYQSRNVLNEDYDPTLGASFYVSKSLNDLNAAYGMVITPTHKQRHSMPDPKDPKQGHN